MIVQAVLFYIFAAVAVASGVLVVSARNPVHSVLFLILAFFNAAARQAPAALHVPSVAHEFPPRSTQVLCGSVRPGGPSVLADLPVPFGDRCVVCHGSADAIPVKTKV